MIEGRSTSNQPPTFLRQTFNYFIALELDMTCDFFTKPIFVVFYLHISNSGTKTL